jgi:electron transport complex protein RnfC
LLPGQLLGQPNGSVRSPVAGKVTAVDLGPDVRGGKPSLGVSIAPSGAAATRLPALDPARASVSEIIERWVAVGVTDGDGVSLAARLEGQSVARVAVLAVDREPALCGTAALRRERWADAAVAARLLARVAGADAVLVVGEPMMAALAGQALKQPGAEVDLVPIPLVYPDSLPALVAARLGGAAVVPLEAALAALDALAGEVPATKVVTVIAGRRPIANYRAPLGTAIRELLVAAKLTPRPGDKVVAGGPLRGFAQYTLDVPIDATVDGLVVIPAADVVKWSDEPCINCGACIDVCPRHLQVQLIGRYAEFGLFERTTDLAIEACIDCGLCATVCTGRRPLLQLIRLAKRELGIDLAGIPADRPDDEVQS